MSVFSDRLKSLREQSQYTQKDIADMLGITQSSYSKYEYGTREPNLETISKISEIFDCSIDYLFGKEPKTMELADVPMLKDVVDKELLFDENFSFKLPKEYADHGTTFVYKMPDDSMTLIGLQKGNLAIAKVADHVNDSDIAVVKVGNEILIRTVSFLENKIVLSPSNTKIPPLLIDKDKVEIIGKVFGLFKGLDNE